MQSLLAAPRQDLTEATVLAALDLEHAPIIRHGVDVLTTADVPTEEEMLVEGGSVSWAYRPPSSGGAAEVRRTAELVIAGELGFSIIARRFRLWTEIVAPDGTPVRFWLGVFVPTLPPLSDDGLVLRRNLKLADKTYLFANRFLEDPLTVDEDENAVGWVIDDLEVEFGEMSFAIPASIVTLVEGRTFEAGTSRLAVYNALLELAGYDQLTADERGRPRSVPLVDLAGKSVETSYEPGGGKIVRPGAVEPLFPSQPNVARFVGRQGSVAAPTVTRLNQSTGPASIDSRGELHVIVQTEAESVEELTVIADAEAQTIFAGGGLRFTGHVGFNPLHSDRDLIELIKPELGLSGAWWLTGWTCPLVSIANGSAVLMPITCEARVAVTEEEVGS